MYQLSDYDFALPPALIASEPVSPRDASRLLLIDRRTGSFTHTHFSQLPFLLPQSCLLVANNSRVFKARFLGHHLLTSPATSQTCAPQATPLLGGKIELLLLSPLPESASGFPWQALLRSGRRAQPGDRFLFTQPALGSLAARLTAHRSDGSVEISFEADPLCSPLGLLPLPPYLKRQAAAQDDLSYQTVYGSAAGSIAAPTAGLHFTTQTLQDLRKLGHHWEEITLHVGLGTFRPVKTSDIRDHQMHQETYSISPQVAQRISAYKNQGKTLLAVGTTTARTLESALLRDQKTTWQQQASSQAKFHFPAGVASTGLFIYPRDASSSSFSPPPSLAQTAHSFLAVDHLLTNFHLPCSTLLMLVCAFGGKDLMMQAYQEAIAREYRFFSYGDAMLIL